MIQKYEVGKDQSPISLKIKVGTVGVAHTKISLVKEGTSLGLANSSKPRSGNIDKTILGKAADLQGVSLFIRVIVDLTYLTKPQRESAKTNLTIDYHIDGGRDGEIELSFDQQTDLIATPQNRILTVTSIINFV